MSNLVTTLKKINESIHKESENFVYFEEKTGSIKKITNTEETESDYKVIKVPHSQVRDILIGKFKYKDFLVTYDVNKKNFVLKRAKQAKINEDIKNEFFCISDNVYLINDDDEITLEEIYKDLEVYLFNINYNYKKGMVVWYKNNIYKTKRNIKIGTPLKSSNSELFIEDVKITDLKISNDIDMQENKIVFEDIYDGIKVDVWYDKLEHLEGQHVWYNNSVYRMNTYQPINSVFNEDNADLILKSVKLYDDDNKFLKFDKNLEAGDKVLNKNQLQIAKTRTANFNPKGKTIFYIDENTILFSKDKTTYLYVNENLTKTENLNDLTNKIFLRRGDKILLGKSLFLVKKLKYQVSRSKDTLDIIRNCKENVWLFKFDNDIPLLNALDSIDFFEKNLYFSITEKDNPNILYRFIKIKLLDLLQQKRIEIPFKYNWEFAETEISIYTNKHFDNYSYGTIK